MTAIRLVAGLIAVLFILGVLSAIVRQRRMREERERLEQLIVPIVYREGMRKADESLPRQAAERRARADAKRLEAARIASGQVREEDARDTHDSHPVPRLLSVDRGARTDAAAAAVRRVRRQG